MEGGRGRENVLEVFGSRFFKAMKRRIGVVLGQPLVIQAVTRKGHRLVLGQRNPDDLPVHLLAIKVTHCFGPQKQRKLIIKIMQCVVH